MKLTKLLPVRKDVSPEDLVDELIEKDPRVISWTRGLKRSLVRRDKIELDAGKLTPALYRPYTKQWLYLDKHLVEYPNSVPRMIVQGDRGNRIIVVKARYSGDGHFALMSDGAVSDQTDGGAYCFPLYIHDGAQAVEGGIPFSESDSVWRDGVAGLTHFQSVYPDEVISKGDLFFYIYGILHSPDYRQRYADNLSKELPRIPRVRKAEDFWTFSRAGRALGDLHVSYETVDKYPLTIDTKGPLGDADYRVEKMKFAKKKDPATGRAVNDRSTVIYNSKITLRDVPEAAWGYIINGKAALEWVMERQAVRMDKASGIVNDANDWAIETMGNPKYPLELFQRVVTVSLETQKIVAALPPLDIRDDG